MNIPTLGHHQQFEAMEATGELLRAIPRALNGGMDIEVTYQHGVTFSGLIYHWDGKEQITIHRSKVPQGVSRTHLVDIDKAVKIVIDSETFQ